jgi:hypothetical protein
MTSVIERNQLETAAFLLKFAGNELSSGYPYTVNAIGIGVYDVERIKACDLIQTMNRCRSTLSSGSALILDAAFFFLIVEFAVDVCRGNFRARFVNDLNAAILMNANVHAAMIGRKANTQAALWSFLWIIATLFHFQSRYRRRIRRKQPAA